MRPSGSPPPEAGIALKPLGRAGEPVLTGIKHIRAVVFRLMVMIMWAAGVTGADLATLLIGTWTHEIDMDRARATLSGQSPFDELSPEPDAPGAPTESEAPSAPGAETVLPDPQTTAAEDQARAGSGR